MQYQINQAEVVDIHAHIVLLETMETAGAAGPFISAPGESPPWFKVGDYTLHGVAYHNSPFTDIDLRLQRMDQTGIDFQVVGPNPLTYLHHIAPTDAQAFCRLHNTALAACLPRGQGRLAGFAALPMQDIGAAIDELDYSIKELGLLGAAIGTDLPYALDGTDMDRFYQKITDLNIPLYMHPTTPRSEARFSDPRFERFDLDIMLGFTVEETLAVATLIFGEVLERHPKLDLCVSHGGGALGFIAGRLAMAAKKRAWAPAALKADGAFEVAIQKLWFDTHVHHHASLALLRRWTNDDRLLFGTNFSGWDQGMDCREEALHVPVDLAGNARRFLRLA
jgi:aminocarboxymuconate-semialdehyde decarboxylase